MHSTLIESVQNGTQILRQTAATFLLQFCGHTEECLCDGACDGGQSIAVAAEGYCSTNHIFEVFALQEGGDGLRDRFLTAFHMPIAGADLIAGTAQIITIGFLTPPLYEYKIYKHQYLSFILTFFVLYFICE